MRIVMMGTGVFAEPTFEALLAAGEQVVGLVTQPDRDPGRRTGATRQTGKGMATIAEAAGIPVASPDSINAPDGLAQLQAFAPDLMVVAAYGQILSPDVLGTPKLGAINVHASLLPKYRGASPVARAVLAGDAKTGVTIIRIVPGLDAGDMLAKTEVDILPDETAGELEARLAPVGAALCLDVVQKFQLGPVSGEPQDEALVTRAPKLKKADGLIDWSKPGSVIARHIRGMQPWPTPYTYYHRPGKDPIRVIVTKVRKFGLLSDITPNRGWIGSLDEYDTGRLLVQVYDGTSVLEVIELQPAGKSKMSAAEFLRGNPIADGSRFGPEETA
ncbi:MAG: methionyl-tRNA formyltransferase [Fimbriiglobus sp.]